MTRTTPYKDVTRAVCVRCGDVAAHEWTGVCAERKGGRVVYHALCRACDVGLNRVALTFVFGPDKAEELMRGYQ